MMSTAKNCIEFAMRQYVCHKLSLSRAASISHVSIFEFLDELKKRNLFVQTDEENLEKNLRELR